MVTILATILCAILYRLGGKKGFNTKFRDLGIPTVITAYILIHFSNPDSTVMFYSIALFLSYGLTFASLTTYMDSVFGYDNFFAHGFLVGLSAFPIVILTGHWWLFAIRCATMAVWAGVWSLLWKDDDIEEGGRLLPMVPMLETIF